MAGVLSLVLVGGCSDDELAADPADVFGEPYLASRNSQVVHRADCKSVKRIKPANLIGYTLLRNVLSEGRRGCKNCLHSATTTRATQEATAHG